MESVSYCELLADCPDPYHYRIKLVEYAVKHGIKSAAIWSRSSRNTVRKWLRGWQTEGP